MQTYEKELTNSMDHRHIFTPMPKVLKVKKFCEHFFHGHFLIQIYGGDPWDPQPCVFVFS